MFSAYLTTTNTTEKKQIFKNSKIKNFEYKIIHENVNYSIISSALEINV